MATYNRRGFSKSPQVKFTRKSEKDIPGTWCVVVRGKERQIDDHLTIFDLTLESAHPELFFGTKEKGKPWEVSEVGPGSAVCYMTGPNEKGQIPQLMDKLQQVPEGQRIKVTYLGKVLNEDTGNEYNDFLVEDAE